VDPDPNPTPDPNLFFIDFKETKIFFFIPYFFLITCPQAHHLQSKKFNFLLKFYFAGTINEKREGSGAGSAPLTNGSESRHADTADPDPVPDPDPQHWLEMNLPGPDADEESRRNPPQGEQTLLLLVHQLSRHNYWVPYA
jgi:hypothetical protein